MSIATKLGTLCRLRSQNPEWAFYWLLIFSGNAQGYASILSGMRIDESECNSGYPQTNFLVLVEISPYPGLAWN